MIEQAKRLSELLNKETQNFAASNKTIAVASGKGGTGKSFFVLNLAFHLASLGKKILLVDLDSNLANIDIMLNISVEKSISDFLQNRVLIKELPQNVRPNLDVIFGDSGKINIPEQRREITDYLISGLEKLKKNYDKILIDTGAGVQSETLYLLSKIDVIALIINPDPTSVMDGYALTKLLLNKYGNKKIGVVVNKCDTREEGDISFKNLNTATTHFLKAELNYLGAVNFSNEVYKSIKEQVIFIEEYRENAIVTQISEIAQNSLLNKM